MNTSRRITAAAALALMLGAGCGMPVTDAKAQATAARDLKPSTAESADVPAKKSAKKKQAAPAADEQKSAARTPGKSEQSIVALVNDEPITGYEVRVRTEMLSGGAVAEYMKNNVEGRWKSMMSSPKIQTEFQEYAKKKQPRTKEELQAIQKEFVLGKRNAMMAQLQSEARNHAGAKTSKAALDELIDEKLKMQEAKRLGAIASDDEVDMIIKGIAERNKMTIDQLAKSLGGTIDPMKQRIRSTLAWNDVIRRKYGHQIAVATKDVEKYVATSNTNTQDDVELVVQRVRINLPAKVDEATTAQRLSQAEAIRAKFTDCKTTSQIITGNPGVRVEELGKRRASAFPEPTRSLLTSAKDNEMLPPSVNEGAVDLFAVCGRSVVKADEQKRTQAEGELKQKEFELLSKKHLKDLRQDASIEYR